MAEPTAASDDDLVVEVGGPERDGLAEVDRQRLERDRLEVATHEDLERVRPVDPDPMQVRPDVHAAVLHGGVARRIVC